MEIYRYKINDKLYDLTDFVHIHPGGTDMFYHLKPDSNVTALVYSYHKNPRSVVDMLTKYTVPIVGDIHYDTNYTYDTYCDLKKIVYDEIHDKKIPLYWSSREIWYNTCMMCLYAGVWTYCFWNAPHLSYRWMVGLACFNIGYAALVFHETSHYVGFKNKKLNNVISYLILSPFISTELWKYEHNYLHHSFTNTEYDCNFENNKYLLRHSNNHPLYFHHQFQFIYAHLLFYLSEVIFPFIAMKHKKWNIALAGILFYYFGMLNATVLYGTTGLLFLTVGQLSHIQHECIQINTEKKHDFLYNQVSSSVNYKTNDPITRLMCFGLDIQIEHHLFPSIPHSSLRRIQPIVRKYCKEHNIPYVEKDSVIPTIYSYVRYLYNMGR